MFGSFAFEAPNLGMNKVLNSLCTAAIGRELRRLKGFKFSQFLIGEHWSHSSGAKIGHGSTAREDTPQLC